MPERDYMDREYETPDPWTPPTRIPGVQYDEYGRPMSPTFREPMDFVRYVDSLGEGATPGSRRQADEIRANPSGWEMSGGHPRQKDDWLAANLPWLGPAIVGGGALGFGLMGGAAGGAGGASGSATTIIPGTGIPTVAGVGGGGWIPPAAGAGGGIGGTLRRFLGGGGDGLNAWQQAALAGLAGLPALFANRGPSDEEKAQLEQLRKLQELQTQRIEHQNPLFQAVTQLAMSRLPADQQQGLPPMGGPSADRR